MLNSSLIFSMLFSSAHACPEEDTYEENDDASQAVSLSAGVYSDVYLCSQDEDWFILPAQVGDLLEVEVLFSHSQSDIDIEVYSMTQERLALSDSITDNEKLHVFAHEEEYLLRVYDYVFHQGSAPYSVSVSYKEPPSCDLDSFPDNNTLQQAVPLMVTPIEGQVCAFDEDWFVVPVLEAQEISFDIQSDAQDGRLDVSLYDAQQQPLKSIEEVEEGRYQGGYLSSTAQEVYVRIQEQEDVGDQYGVLYTLEQTSNQYTSCTQDDLGGPQIDPSPLGAGMYELSVCSEEWYVFTSTENLQISISMEHDVADGVLVSKFFSQGILLQESEENAVFFNHRSGQGEESEDVILQLRVKEDAQNLGIVISLELEESPVVSIEPDSQPIEPTQDSQSTQESKETGCGGGLLLPLVWLPIFSLRRRETKIILKK